MVKWWRVMTTQMLLGVTATQAQSVSMLSEQDFLAEVPMVLSVARLPQRLDETPGAVTILDRNWIRQSGARDLADLLRLVPGFQSSNSFAGDMQQASYHGGNGEFSNRLQVLVDGRSVYSSYLLGSTGLGLQSLSLDDIERVEVLRGSNSAAYGARAFLGVVNIVSRDTKDPPGLALGVTSGQNGVRDVSARWAYVGVNLGLRVSVDQRGDDGLLGAQGTTRVRRFNTRADVRLSDRDEIELRAGLVEALATRGFDGRVGNPVRQRSDTARHVQLDWRRTLDADQVMSAQFSMNHERYTDRFPYTPVPGLIVDFGGLSTDYAVLLQHTVRHGATLRSVWGAEFRGEAVQSAPVYNRVDAIRTEFTRLFGNAEWRVAPSWVVNAGGLFEHSSLSGDTLAPRLAVNWHLAPGHTVRGGVSRSFRPPSPYEKFADTRYFHPVTHALLEVTAFASGKVGPESVLARELGYLADWPSIGLNADVRLFHEKVSDVIGAYRKLPAPARRPYDYVNQDRLRIRGLEYQLSWRAWPGGDVMFNQTFTRISDSFNNDSLHGAADNALSLVLMHQFASGTQASVSYNKSGPAALQGAAVLASRERLDLRVATPVAFGPARGELALVVQNLGPAYTDYDPLFSFARRAFVTLRVQH
jgi:iron complex outermembrane receptor protein